jgi:CRISPR-associated protein Csc2
MTILSTLKSEFQTVFPRLASGKYIHFIMLRHSQSFPVFQTDGVLNIARTQAGLKHQEKISRLVMFKRKQVSPERLVGRELLRSLGLIDSEDKKAENFCRYGGELFCSKCPDCIIYGFAVGDNGAERSKLYSDSAFSLSQYEISHKSFTFNSLSEAGTMMLDSDDPKRTDSNKNRSSINELDHVIPEVTFPTVETLRDSTYEGFLYVLGNLLRTKRYGAQESRTGTMRNYIGGIVLCDGEIFSNLHFTQALYDALKGDVDTPVGDILQQVKTVSNNLLSEEPVRKNKLIFGAELEDFIGEVNGLFQDEARLMETMTALYGQTKAYAESFGALKKKSK